MQGRLSKRGVPCVGIGAKPQQRDNTCLLGTRGHCQVTHMHAQWSQLLQDQLLVAGGAQEAGQTVLLHQSVDSLLRQIEAALGGFHQVPHRDVLGDVIDIHLWAQKQGRESAGVGEGQKWNFSAIKPRGEES